MDILLSHGYFIAEDAHEQKIMKPYPTLGLLYISSHLKAKGFAVEVFDTTFRTMTEFESYVQEHRPGLVGLYCNLMTKRNILRQMAICRAAGSLLILGGPEPVSYAGEYLAAGADIVVDGEGEETLAELIPHLARHGRHGLEKIAGLVYLDDQAQITRAMPRTQIQDLSSQPWPDREAIQLERYLATWKAHHGLSSVSLITARGCPYKCRWCSHTVFGHTHRRRRPEEVVEEVAWIRERYNPDQLWYADDVLTIHPRWFLTYAELLKKRGLHLPFEAISRADRLNDQVVEALREMGCYRLWIGAESGSQRVLDAMERKADVADIQHKTKMLQAQGIEVGMFIMLGYEAEEESDIVATVDHLKEANPDVFLTTVAYPIKGTPYHKQVSDRIIAPHNWAEHTDRDLKVAGRHSRAYYDQATRWMVSEVGLNRMRKAGSRQYWRMAKLFMNARRGRLGMRLTRDQRENGLGQTASGRGWATEERATEGW